MQIFSKLNINPNLSLALGFFDGVHLGHKKVIEEAVNYARNNGVKSAVITFSEHPCCYLSKVAPQYIMTKNQKRNAIEKLGIDFIYELDFPKLSNLSADEYLREILVKHFSPVAITTGWNHYFGSKKSGDVKFLRNYSEKYHYKYFELLPQKINNKIVSSTAIRTLLSQGKIEAANQMLGRKFEVSGEIIKGNQIGRTIGFPTANLIYPQELTKLPHGVYSVETNFGKGIANFGTRPTVNGVGEILEVNIKCFNENIYGQNLIVKFDKMLRPEQKFPSLDELKKQIEIDIKSI